MARRHTADANDDTDCNQRKGSLLGRRNFLKLAGTATVGVAAFGGSAVSGAAASHETVEVPAGESQTFSVGSGETLENLLVDVTADGADCHISASGDGWTIRNVGVRGTFDVGAHGGGGFSNVMSLQGDGTLDNVYLGDGVQTNVAKGAIGVSNEHSGQIDVSRTNIGAWSANAVYAAGSGRIRPPGKTDGGGGAIAFDTCYFRDNNIAHLRIAADGSDVTNCVFENTGNVPAHPNTKGGDSGVVNSRGIYTGYGDPEQVITVKNSDINITSENTNGAGSAIVSGDHGTYGELTTVRVQNSQVLGELIGDNVETSNVGDNPDTSIPSGVPTNAEQAASGSSSGGSGSGGSGGNTTEGSSGNGNVGTGAQTLSISGGSASNKLHYSFSVGEKLEKSTANGGTTSPEDVISGTSAEGLVAGGTDSYEVTGAITAFDADGGISVTLDGRQVDPSDVVETPETETPNTETPDTGTPDTETPTDGSPDDGNQGGSTSYDNVLVIDGTQNSERTTRYTFSVSGSVRRNDSRSEVVDGGLPWDAMSDSVDGDQVVGIVGNGVDAFDYSGRLTNVDVQGAATFTVVRE